MRLNPSPSPQLNLDFKAYKPNIPIEKVKDTPLEFEFKTFTYNPNPGDLINEIYRYMEFLKNNGDKSTNQNLFETSLDKIVDKYHYTFGANDITSNTFKTTARNNWNKKSH